MRLQNKKMVFVGLSFITVGATIAGIFSPPIFAIAGTALIGTIAVGKMIISHKSNREHQAQAPQHGVTPHPNPNDIHPSHDSVISLSPALTHWVEEKNEELVKPALGRDFSMHITYHSNQHSPKGAMSPEAINISVHTRDTGAATPPVPLAPRDPSPETPSVIPSPPRLRRKVTLPESANAI